MQRLFPVSSQMKPLPVLKAILTTINPDSARHLMVLKTQEQYLNIYLAFHLLRKATLNTWHSHSSFTSRKGDITMSTSSALLSDQLVDMAFITAYTEMTDKWFYKLISQGKFPKPIKLGRSSRWLKSEVEAWMHQIIADSRNRSECM